jgi:BASS family bile acid:Na+ symporter
MQNLLQNSPLVFTTAIILGIINPKAAEMLREFVIPCLVIVMMLSLSDLKFKEIRFGKAIPNLLLNYAFLSSLIILLSIAIIEDIELRLGFFVMAAAPPAIAIVPFSKLLGGNTSEAVISNGIIYILSLFLAPSIILMLTGKTVDALEILQVLFAIILIPMALSRFFRVKRSKEWINLCLALVIYTVIGLNVETLKNLFILMDVTLLSFLRTFVSGTLVFLLLMQRLEYGSAITKTLFASYKNLGFVAGLSLVIFGDKASIPAAICILFEVLLFNYFLLIRKILH